MNAPAASAGPIIEAEGLSKWFGEIMALNDVSVAIGGGVTGLLGPNGAGKSTLIKLILGLHTPSRGTLQLWGETPRNNPRVLRRIGYCPEVDSFYESMTGLEYVTVLNQYQGMPKQQARVAAEEACDLVGMAARMNDPVDEYSKGMRQRIKIAQAIAHRPELLFLDEPMTGLDPTGREEMFALIRWLGEHGWSVVVSSPILHEVERVTDNVVLLYNGSILAHGKVHEIRELIDEHPHTITVESSDPRAVAQPFLQDDSMLSIEFGEDTLVIRTTDPNRCYERLNALAASSSTPIEAIRCDDDNLQAVFDYLTK